MSKDFEVVYRVSSNDYILPWFRSGWHNPVQFPNAIVLNVVGRTARSTQKGAKGRKRVQKSANASPQKSSKERKRVQKSARALLHKNSKPPGLKQTGLGTPKTSREKRVYTTRVTASSLSLSLDPESQNKKGKNYGVYQFLGKTRERVHTIGLKRVYTIEASDPENRGFLGDIVHSLFPSELALKSCSAWLREFDQHNPASCAPPHVIEETLNISSFIDQRLRLQCCGALSSPVMTDGRIFTRFVKVCGSETVSATRVAAINPKMTMQTRYGYSASTPQATRISKLSMETQP